MKIRRLRCAFAVSSLLTLASLTACSRGGMVSGGNDLGGFTFGSDAPSCGDGVRDGDETDVDCGGPACPAEVAVPGQRTDGQKKFIDSADR